MYRLLTLIFSFLLTACAPTVQSDQASENVTPEVQESIVTKGVSSDLNLLDLSIKAITVPEADVEVPVLSFLTELTAFETEGDKGTIKRLGFHLEMSQNNQQYLVLTAKVERILGEGGVHLLLFKEVDGAFEQLDTVKVGGFVQLIDLSLKENLIEVITIDEDLGKLNATGTEGGLFKYSIEDNVFNLLQD